MRRCVFFAALLAMAAAACSTGEGSGSVTSTNLYVKDCWNGPFDLRPTFFASDPFGDTQQIRVQRGERTVAVSDGVSFVVNHVSRIRDQIRNDPTTTIEIGLPVGVRPPGFPIRVTTSPPDVSLTLYLNDTCHVQNGALHAIGGKITFKSLFSGDRNENNSEARRTEAEFTATVVDPRDAELVPDGDGGVEPAYAEGVASEISGYFNFFFQRGSPAQPFP